MGDVVQGPWPTLPPNKRAKEWPPPGFKQGGMGHLSDVEARRTEILRARPKCSVCEVIYPLNVRVPDDRICRQCRRDLERAARDQDAPEIDLTIFD